MVARKTNSRSQSPYYSVHVELDNRALKAKNNGLTQALAKLQQENAELSKQLGLIQAENFEVNSRYNNLKNVISIIDSTTRTCLPKFTEVVDTFTGIIQLCCVASNISNGNTNRDTRTQAVKPQIVNGHVLHNPTITLSRLDNSSAAYPYQRPSTSRSSFDPNTERRVSNNNSHDEDIDSENEEGTVNETGEQNISFRCQANRGVSGRKRSSTNDVAEYQDDSDSDDSDQELETPAAEEEAEDAEGNERRLTPIEEGEEEAEEEEEEEETFLSPNLSPRASTQRTFLKGRLQEVRIYLNQLPNTCAEQFSSSGNISISVSPPERRASFKNRPSSLFGEADESNVGNSPSFLEENSLSLNRTIRVTQREGESPPFNNNKFVYSDSISAIHNLPTPSTSRHPETVSDDSTVGFEKSELSRSDGSDKTFTFMSPRKSSPLSRSDSYDDLSTSFNNDTSLSLTSKITKRRNTSTEKRRIAKVLLNRLSFEKRRLSGSPLRNVNDIVKTSPIMKLSQIKTRLRSSGNSIKEETDNMANGTSHNEEGKERNILQVQGKNKKKKKDSPIKKAASLKKEKVLTPKLVVPAPPRKSPGRPKRAAKPKTLKEPNLVKLQPCRIILSGDVIMHSFPGARSKGSTVHHLYENEKK